MSADEEYPDPRKPEPEPVEDAEDLLPYARRLVNESEGASTVKNTTGYADLVEAGDRVLIAVRHIHDEDIVTALARAFRENDVLVDVVTIDIGLDSGAERPEDWDAELALTDPTEKETGEEDSYSEILGRFSWTADLAAERGYDLLIQGTAGNLTPDYPDAHLKGDPFYAERLPWQSTESFASEGTFFPKEILQTIYRRTNEILWEHGQGATIRVTDPEGSDLSYTLFEEYFDNRRIAEDRVPDDVWEEYYAGYDKPLRNVGASYRGNHLRAFPRPPLVDQSDASGVIASTLGHFSKPYPRIELHLEGGKVTEIKGGGAKGERMREVQEETKDVHYPDYPDTGMFWMMECSIGMNPKVVQPSEIVRLSDPGALPERLRSGYIHIGTGTGPRSYSEDWADERGIHYGHVDHHLTLPTFEIEKPDGETITLIEKGRLATLDDPEVREVASKYGDPDELLEESWMPAIPGINYPGDYDEYAENPAEFIENHTYQ